MKKRKDGAPSLSFPIAHPASCFFFFCFFPLLSLPRSVPFGPFFSFFASSTASKTRLN